MNLYDSIKNPIENDDVLKELIEFYKKDENPKTNLYNKLVTSTDSREFNEKKYTKDFEELIVRPTMEELYKNIGTRIGLNEDVFGNNSSILKSVFSECPTYEDFRKKVEETTNEMQRNKLKKCFWVFTRAEEDFDKYDLTYDHQDWYDEAREIFSDKEIYSLAPYVCLEERMHQYLRVSDNVMGFHINADKKMDLNMNNEGNELKFYINAGDDTCKVASLFRDKCKKEKMNYYFKVADPYKDRLDRADRLCIYTEMKHIQNFLNMLQEIKQENPQIKFEKPPMMVGNIDNWIGIASDYSGDKYADTSYNIAMSKVCMNALDEVFANNGQAESLEEDDAKVIEDLRTQILIQAQNMGYSKDKICIKPKFKRTLERIDIDSSKNNKKGILQMQNIVSSLNKSKIRDVRDKKYYWKY